MAVLHRALAALILSFALTSAGAAQSERELAQMRMHIQQLEEQVRYLTGEVERLQHEVRQLRAAAGLAGPAPDRPQATWQEPGLQSDVLGGANSSAERAAPPQDLGTLSISPDDPRIAPDGAAAPLDLSALAGGPVAGPGNGRGEPFAVPQIEPLSEALRPGQPSDLPPTGALPGPTAALSGSAGDQYDLAYGYILTGDFAEAEVSFRDWLRAFPDHELAGDARFWLAESQFRQEKYRESANLFMEVYQGAPEGRKAPNALVRLGSSLAHLGEKAAACATFQEVRRKFPDTGSLIDGQLANEAQRAGC